MLEWTLVALAALNLLLLLWLLLRRADTSLQNELREDAERQGRELRNEVQESARGTRQELSQTLSLFQSMLLTQAGRRGAHAERTDRLLPRPAGQHAAGRQRRAGAGHAGAGDARARRRTRRCAASATRRASSCGALADGNERVWPRCARPSRRG
jgi:DNA recombination protein RmuC